MDGLHRLHRRQPCQYALYRLRLPNREALERYPDYYLEQEGEELDPEIFEIMVTPPETLERCEAYLNLPGETLTLYKDLWTQLGVD